MSELPTIHVDLEDGKLVTHVYEDGETVFVDAYLDPCVSLAPYIPALRVRRRLEELEAEREENEIGWEGSQCPKDKAFFWSEVERVDGLILELRKLIADLPVVS